MADKKKEGANDPSKKIVGIIRWVVTIIVGLLIISALKEPLTAWVSGIRKESQAEAATVAFRQTERDERQYTVTVYPLSVGQPTVIKPGVVNFKLSVDQKHLGSGLRLVIQVDGYMSRRYIYDVDSNENLELRAKPGDRSKRVHYPPATYLECWIDQSSPVQTASTIWIEKLPE